MFKASKGKESVTHFDCCMMRAELKELKAKLQGLVLIIIREFSECIHSLKTFD